MTMKNAGSLSYQKSGCSLAGDGLLASTEFPFGTPLHNAELIEWMQ